MRKFTIAVCLGVLFSVPSYAGGSSDTKSIGINYLFGIDDQDPVISISSPAAGAFISSKDVEILWTVDPGPSGLFQVESSTNGSNWTVSPSTFSYTFTELPEGEVELYLKATDNVNNSSTESVSVIIDVTDPEITISSGKYFATSTVSAEWTVDAGPSGIASQRVSIDGGSNWIAVSTATLPYTYDFPAVSDGAFELKVEVTDRAGNIATSTAAVVVDTIPPVIDAGLNVISSTTFNTTAARIDEGEWRVMNDDIAIIGLSGEQYEMFPLKKDSPATNDNNRLNWDSAVEWATNLEWGTYSDWTLPDVAQLLKVYDALGTVNFGYEDIFYWTSEEFDELRAYNVDFSNGFHDYFAKTLERHVRAVRNGSAPAVAEDSGSGILSYFWEQLSGPGTITFSADDELSTAVDADENGEYLI